MQKIITLLIITLFVTSCTNNTENEINEMTGALDIENEINEMTGALDIEEDLKDEVISNTGIINNTVIENTNSENNTNSDTIDISGDISSGTSDEAALESEVNDLLDEFIDSLDSYDK